MKTGDYASLAHLAHQKREQSEYEDELRAVIAHCTTAKNRLRKEALFLGTRAKIWAHLVDAIDLAERELGRVEK